MTEVMVEEGDNAGGKMVVVVVGEKGNGATR